MDQTSVSVTMTVTQWNTVLAALGELPFKLSNDIIGVIKVQAEAQLAPKPAEAPVEAPAEAPAQDASAQ
jgi:hypothetical protein